MKPREMMPIEHDQAQMWQLSADRRRVLLQFGLAVQGTIRTADGEDRLRRRAMSRSSSV
jgi:hypothetical protein